jgi:hypothetical protein
MKTMAVQTATEALKYHERADADLVSSAKAGDNLAMEFLLNKYKNFVRIKTKSYFLIGGDREDIIQEGTIGLYKAIRDFKADKLSSFRAFAELCITRQISGLSYFSSTKRAAHASQFMFTPLLAPIFAFAAILFLAYAIALIAPSAHAVLETFAPIYTVDGYIRYRTSQKAQPEYYVAVLSADRQVLGEWPLREWPPSIGKRELWPALVEFSRYGGIHKIDGRPTGVLPAEIAPFGVGVARDAERHSLVGS